MKKEVLLVFQKNEVLGKVKTRLAASVGEKQALEIYLHLVAKTYFALRDISVSITTYFSDFVPENPAYPAGRGMVQVGKDLGARMKNAFSTNFDSGMEKVVLIGTDCPSIEGSHILQAFDALDQSDLVIGPALDGGYYLIGLKQRADFLFEGISWSTDLVLSQTLAFAAEQGLQTHLLPVLEDIDTLEDWDRYCSQVGDMPYIRPNGQLM